MDHRDSDDCDEMSDPAVTVDFSVGSRVRVNPGTSDERWGLIVEDFVDDAGYGVNSGSHQIADSSRRWAVALDDGNLVFVDSTELADL